MYIGWIYRFGKLSLPKLWNSSMALCKTAVSPLLPQWRYCSLALSHRLEARSEGTHRPQNRNLFICCVFPTTDESSKTILHPWLPSIYRKAITPGQWFLICYTNGNVREIFATPSMASWHIAVSPLLPQWKYCSLALSHQLEARSEGTHRPQNLYLFICCVFPTTDESSKTILHPWLPSIYSPPITGVQ